MRDTNIPTTMIVGTNQIALASILFSLAPTHIESFTISSPAINTLPPPPKNLGRLSAASADDFDPLLSPHAYPKGTPSNNLDDGHVSNQEQKEEGDDWSPMKLNSVKNDFKGSSDQEYTVEKAAFTRPWSTVSVTSSAFSEKERQSANEHSLTSDATAPKEDEEEVASEKLFDPLLSPHAYPKGTSSRPIASPFKPKQIVKQQVGVLLVDHGSKRQSSNQRLELLKEMYENSPNTPSHYTIKAAHMEIAPPSIKDQMEAFYQEGITKIVCHPYFLSPGRHVLEDIPELIQEAELYLKDKYGVENLEVLSTEPVGSKLDLMIGLIGNMVEESLGEDSSGEEGYESGFVEKEKDPMALGGFLGNVKRMMDEQL